MPAGAITLADITSADWSLMLDSTAAELNISSGLGYVVQGLDDVDQCVSIILSTPRGSDPLRPTFACDVARFIDKPINRVYPQIVREVTEALETWEPRITVLSVAVAPVVDSTSQSGAHLNISVTWQLKLSGSISPRALQQRTTVVTVTNG